MSKPGKDWLDIADVALHEATHAVVAQKMGLPVSWVTINPGCDEGINFGAAVKIPDELIDRKRDLFAICVSMAAPVHLHDHRGKPIGHYAQLEFEAALEIAGYAGHEAGAVYDESERLVEEHYSEIIDLSHRLRDEGMVTFEEVAA